MTKLKKVILAGLLLAAAIVFNRFLSIKTPIVVISFGFIPKIIIATMFGPWWSMLLFGLADLIGALLFPFGAYFVGYTASAVISGFIYGIFLHRKKKIPAKTYLWKLIVACLLSNLICNLLLNSVWIYVTTKKAISVILPTRIVKELVTVPIYVAIMFGMHVFFEKYKVYDMALGKTDEESVEDESDLKNKENSVENNKKIDKNSTKKVSSETNSGGEKDETNSWKC